MQIIYSNYFVRINDKIANSKWKMENGKWKMANRKWQMAQIANMPLPPIMEEARAAPLRHSFYQMPEAACKLILFCSILPIVLFFFSPTNGLTSNTDQNYSNALFVKSDRDIPHKTARNADVDFNYESRKLRHKNS